MDLFSQIKTFAEPLMEAFQTDLEHDRVWITAHPDTPFIHVTRRTGTHIIPVPLPGALKDDAPIPHLFGEARPSEVYRQSREFLCGQLGTSARLWLYFDGERLRKSSQAICLKEFDQGLAVARRYAERVRRRAS